MAKTKSKGSTSLGRDSQPKYLGIKIADKQSVKIGMILARQRGSKFKPGKNVAIGKDDTLYALKSGKAKFQTKRIKRFDKKRRLVKIINVV